MMKKITVKIDGMACGMCEAHVNDCIRANFAVKKVTSSFKKGETVILAEQAPDEEALRKAIAATGYEVTDVRTEEAEEHHGFHLFGKK